MSALFYGNLDDTRSTEIDWLDDEEFEILEKDLEEFDIAMNLSNKSEIVNSTKVFISFLDPSSLRSQQTKSTNLQTIGRLSSKYLNGSIHRLSDGSIWFSLSSLEHLPSRSYASKVIERLCNELFPKLLTNQSIHLLSKQPSFDHQLEYYTNQQTDDLKAFQIESLPIMLTRTSDGLLFEYLIKHNKKIHLLKLPMILDEVPDLKNYLPIQLYDELNKKNNYLISSSNLYA